MTRETKDEEELVSRKKNGQRKARKRAKTVPSRCAEAEIPSLLAGSFSPADPCQLGQRKRFCRDRSFVRRRRRRPRKQRREKKEEKAAELSVAAELDTIWCGDGEEVPLPD